MISPQATTGARDHQKSEGGTLQEAVVGLGFVKEEEEEIVRLLSRQYNVPFLDLHAVEVDPQVVRMISAATGIPLTLPYCEWNARLQQGS